MIGIFAGRRFISDVTGFRARILPPAPWFRGSPVRPSKYDLCWKSVPLTGDRGVSGEAFRIACNSIFAAAAGRPPSAHLMLLGVEAIMTRTADRPMRCVVCTIARRRHVSSASACRIAACAASFRVRVAFHGAVEGTAKIKESSRTCGNRVRSCAEALSSPHCERSLLVVAQGRSIETFEHHRQYRALISQFRFSLVQTSAW